MANLWGHAWERFCTSSDLRHNWFLIFFSLTGNLKPGWMGFNLRKNSTLVRRLERKKTSSSQRKVTCCVMWQFFWKSSIQSTPFITGAEGTSLARVRIWWQFISNQSNVSSITYLCLGFNCCSYYRRVRYSGLSARRELTVIDKLVAEARKKYIYHFSAY